MELRHLRYFVALADEQHLGRAAARLHVSPSPLSRQLHELEAELGVRLLERVGRGIRTTDAGMRFAMDARAILADVDRAVSKVGAVKVGETGHLAIGFQEMPLFARIIPIVVKALRRQHPSATVELVPGPFEDLRAALHARRIVAALGMTLGAPDADLRAELLSSEPIVLALPQDHPLASRKRIYARDLHDQPFVWSSRPTRAPFLDGMWSMLRSRGVMPRVVIESRSTITRHSLVASGVGMTFSVDSWQRPAGVVTRRIVDLAVEARAYVFWRDEDDASRLLRWFRRVTVNAARAAPK